LVYELQAKVFKVPIIGYQYFTLVSLLAAAVVVVAAAAAIVVQILTGLAKQILSYR
jgi:hypothetical protein